MRVEQDEGFPGGRDTRIPGLSSDLLEVWLVQTREGSASLEFVDWEFLGKLPIGCASAPGLTSRVLLIALSNID